MPVLRVVLLDVGGTLWPQYGPPESPALRIERLVSMVPSLDAERAAQLLGSLAAAPEPEDGGPQDIHAYLRHVVLASDLQLGDRELEQVRRALCLPATRMFPNAPALIQRIRELRLRCAIVSNALVRSGEDYANDFTSLGLADCVSAYVSSIDVHMRKPHPLPFLRALELIGVNPQEAVMVGDSEKNDIVPARALGLRTIRVAIEPRPPADTVADARCTDLLQVAATLAQWAWHPPGEPGGSLREH